MREQTTRAAIVRDRVAAIRELIERREAPAALLSLRANVAWATLGAEAHVVLATQEAVAALLVTRDTAAVLTPVNEASRIDDEELGGVDLEVVDLPWHEAGAMEAEARRRAGGEPLDDAALEDDLLPLRCRLAAPELERLTWLADRSGEAVAEGLALAAAGCTEHEVAAEAARALGIHGVRAPVLLAAADDRIARYRHPLPTERPIDRRVMLVVVAERWGLHVALTRFADLAPPDDEVSRRMAASGRIHAAMVGATRPGATLGDVIVTARRAYADAGHPDEWELHHQGGIIGYQGRERIAVPDDTTPIEVGMAFAWNPSIAGAKAEETILLDGPEPRVLTA